MFSLATDRLPALIELVHTDLERRLKVDQKVHVETYLKKYPELGKDAGGGESRGAE